MKWLMAPAGCLLLMGTACSGDELKAPTAEAVVDVAAAEHTPYNLSVAASEDLVAIAWNDYDDEAAVEAAAVAVSTDGGATFGAPVIVDPTDPYAAYPQVAMTESGVIYVGVTLYEENEADGRPGLYRSADKGATFDLVADLADAPRVSFTAVGTSVAVSPDGETVLMTWAAPGDDDGPGPLVAVASTDGGATFGDPIDLAPQAGAGRARAFFDAERAGVVATEHIPIADAPAPTPANPNPVTFVPQATLWPFEKGAFAAGRALTSEPAEALDEGPGASGTAVAWWEPSAESASLRTASVTDAKSAATDVLPAPLRVPAPVEVASDADGSWFLTMDVPDAEGVEPAPLVLARARDGGASEVVPVLDATATRSGEEFDLAVIDDGKVLVAWLADGSIRTRRVSG